MLRETVAQTVAADELAEIYGEGLKSGLDLVNFRRRLRNAASVCKAFETSRRREVLSFTHHAGVAALPPDEAGIGPQG
jgi:hypothetical protein